MVMGGKRQGHEGVSMEIQLKEQGFDVLCGGRLVLVHNKERPAFSLAKGKPSWRMVRGHFAMDDAPFDHVDLAWVTMATGRILLAAAQGQAPLLVLEPGGPDGCLRLTCTDPAYDRLTIRLHGEPGEAFWGGGEQLSYLNMAGRRFPMWTSEPGVGRDKTTLLSQRMDELALAGGDYWTTCYPQPTFLSSRRYACHLESNAYAVLDFTCPKTPCIEVWQGSTTVRFFESGDLIGLVEQLSGHFGRQPPLPSWALKGAIIGLKDGVQSFERLDDIMAAGAVVAALWCEDWVGTRQTSFGRRLFWDWHWNPERYPDLPQRIAELASRGVRFLGYVNPALAADGEQFAEAQAGRHLVCHQDGTPYLVDFGEFQGGLLDWTRQETRAWFAEHIIGKEMLDLGMAGWMADFGEYLPPDAHLADGSDPMLTHNRWPVLWASVNDQALEARGKSGEVMFFMRAGFSGSQALCPLLWAGDQLVDFSRHDGIGTAITAALSAGLVGNAKSHSDIGGYTSLFGVVRTAELLMRWAELAAFTPVMRSHEGNRPEENLQIDSAPDILAHFAAMTRIHAALAPYVHHLCAEALQTGLPLQRPLFLHYPDEVDYFDLQDQYLYGADLLVAPVIEPGAEMRRVHAPPGQWRHLWSGKVFAAGVHEVPAPLGQPAVFSREGSAFAPLFATLPVVGKIDHVAAQ